MLFHLERCSKFDYIAVDTEGYAPNILGISTSNPLLECMYFPIGHREDVNIDEEVYTKLREVLATRRYRVFHAAGHDLIALPYLFDLPFLDTMILAHMLDENVMSKGLDYLSKFYCGNEGKRMHPLMDSIIKTQGWEAVPYALMNDYAAWDARITMALFQRIMPMYEEQFGSFWSKDVVSA